MIRPYQPTDYQEVLDLFLLNTPTYFAPEEQKDLEEYLHKYTKHFFVFEQESQILGVGGYNILDKEGRISWYFIHPDSQGQGIGKALVQYSLESLKKEPGIELIVVRTSQHAWRFFEKMGFELYKKEKDFWAPGIDLYQMKLSS